MPSMQEFNRLPLCGACKIDEIREVAVDVDGHEVVSEVEAVAEGGG